MVIPVKSREEHRGEGTEEGTIVVWVAYSIITTALIAGAVYLIVHNHPWFGGLLLLMTIGMSAAQHKD